MPATEETHTAFLNLSALVGRWVAWEPSGDMKRETQTSGSSRVIGVPSETAGWVTTVVNSPAAGKRPLQRCRQRAESTRPWSLPGCAALSTGRLAGERNLNPCSRQACYSPPLRKPFFSHLSKCARLLGQGAVPTAFSTHFPSRLAVVEISEFRWKLLPSLLSHSRSLQLLLSLLTYLRP